MTLHSTVHQTSNRKQLAIHLKRKTMTKLLSYLGITYKEDEEEVKQLLEMYKWVREELTALRGETASISENVSQMRKELDELKEKKENE